MQTAGMAKAKSMLKNDKAEQMFEEGKTEIQDKPKIS